MNTYNKLIGNSIIFAIGNLGSKLISIILVPLYTFYLSTSEYGVIDIVTTTTSMLLPVISLSIYDAVLRFIMDKTEQEDSVFTTALLITILGTVVSILVYFVLNFFNVLSGLLSYTTIILILQAFQSLLAQFTRAIGKIKIYSLNGIIMTIVTGAMNVILLMYFNMGIKGYLLSLIVANVVSIGHIALFTRIGDYIDFDKLNKKMIKRMLTYCIPLIPNTFMWWIMSASDRYFILFFVGASANGIYAVANKIPSLLSILNSVFFQAWQLSAIEEYDSNDKSKFYSDVFEYFAMVMFLGTSGVLMILKYLMKSVVSPEFYSSWEFVPFLLLGVVFSSFSGFLGTNYIAAKQTKGVFRTSIVGGIINIVLNLIFIPIIGTNGAGLATMISFFIIWIFRIYDTKRFIDMKLNIKGIIMNMLIISMQIGILFMKLRISTEFLFELSLFIILLFFNRRLFTSVKKLLFK